MTHADLNATSIFVLPDALGATADDRGRRDTAFRARLVIGASEESLMVSVRNLSAGGLMVDALEPLPVDEAIEIEVQGVGWVAGRIAWQAAGRAGIAFDVPIDPAAVRLPA